MKTTNEKVDTDGEVTKDFDEDEDEEKGTQKNKPSNK